MNLFGTSQKKTISINVSNIKVNNAFEFYQQISFMKAGIFYADHLSTVSPTYAEGIQTDAYGFGMQGLLKTRHAHLTGILNGIDTKAWNPATDKHLTKHYPSKGQTTCTNERRSYPRLLTNQALDPRPRSCAKLVRLTVAVIRICGLTFIEEVLLTQEVST